MQARRLTQGGHIDRHQMLGFTFNGQLLQGYYGDTLASALLANNIILVARSIKFHRPRGIMTAGLEEACALVTCLDRNGVPVPNLKVTEVQLKSGLVASSQNCWPRVDFDLASFLQLGSALLNAGFYYKTFMWPKNWWHQCYEKIIRRAAGQGIASTKKDLKTYDRRLHQCELLIIGSGPTGLAAALAAAEKNTSVVIAEQDHQLGGSSNWEQTDNESMKIDEWRQQALAVIEKNPNIKVMTNCLVFGQYDHGSVMAVERNVSPVDSISWRFRAGRILLASGATEKPLVFSDNDRPGIMLAASVRQYIYRYAVMPGRHAMLAIADIEERELTRQALLHAGIKVVGELQDGEQISRTQGRRRLRKVEIIDANGNIKHINCDLLCVSAGWSPNAQLLGQLGVRLDYDSNHRSLIPLQQMGLQLCAGAARGLTSVSACIQDGKQQALNAVAQLQSHQSSHALPAIPESHSKLTHHGGSGLAFVDYQNDVLRSDLELAVREGYEHVELVKRYTTLGMGTDQGKTSWVNAITELERITSRPASEIGHTSFRPPYSPVSIGALIGAEVGQHMTPIRQTPFHQVFKKFNCIFQTSGDWVYSRYFPLADETMDQAIQREVKAIRNQVGCIDMSTLGKVDVKGSDALKFLSRVYCNDFAKIEPGRLRYVLMLREDGILWDDGTIAQLSIEHFLVTTTSANSASVWLWLNRLLQIQWPDLDVQITLVSDHWASLAITGPKARILLQKLQPNFKTDQKSFPFASVRVGTLEDTIPCRIFSVSFSGELSYEINVPASYADWLFETVMERGQDNGVTAYGLETLDVLRIEKGHLSIGTEIDGRTTPMDLGLKKMVSTKKSFIGSSLLQRPALNESTRPQLVGLTPIDGKTAIPVAALLCDQPWRQGVLQTSQGILTASIYSPSLKQPIALALLENGQQRHGEQLWAVSPIAKQSVKVTVGPSCFYDLKGERVHD